MKETEIIAIGSELLSPFRMDTNSLFLTRTLEECGFRVVAKTVIGDEVERIVESLANAFARAEVIICMGGLGPTVDDLTREAVSQYLKLPLEFHQEILDGIAERFRKFGRKMPEVNRKQAMVPQGGTVLSNHHGSAPGLYLRSGDKQIFLLPGPPFELEPMWKDYGIPKLERGHAFVRRVLRVAMLPESQVDQTLLPLTSTLKNVTYTILAAPSQIEIHLLAPESKAGELEEAVSEARRLLGDAIFGENDTTLEESVGILLKKVGKTLSVAESCTGGWLAQRITNVAGSSAYFDRGVVTYSNQAKTELLGVPPELIAQHGAVSEPVATSMAQGIRERAKTDFALSITGVAGPEGGTEQKPVGLVYVGLASKTDCQVKEFRFPVGRERVRFAATQAALNMLRLQLIRNPG
jgi:competence/damage-inducible protein CinA-like protein